MVNKQLLKWWILFGLILQPALSLSVPVVGSSHPECRQASTDLFCDYKDSNLDNVRLTTLEEDNVERVFISNIRKLYLSDSACVNVTLLNITEVVIEEGNNTCTKPLELTAKQCTLKSAPVNINSLHLEDCEVTSITTASASMKLTLLNSVIQNMSSIAIGSGFNMLVDSSEGDHTFMILSGIFFVLFFVSLVLNLILVVRFLQLRKMLTTESINEVKTIQATDISVPFQIRQSNNDTKKQRESVALLHTAVSDENKSLQVTDHPTDVIDVDTFYMRPHVEKTGVALSKEIEKISSKSDIGALRDLIDLRFKKLGLTTAYRCSLFSGALYRAKKQSKEDWRNSIINEESEIEMCLSKILFKEKEESLNMHLMLLTTPHEKDFYKNSMNVNDDLLSSYMHLSKTLSKNSAVSKALNHIVESIRSIELFFYLDLQHRYEQDLVNTVSFLEKLIS